MKDIKHIRDNSNRKTAVYDVNLSAAVAVKDEEVYFSALYYNALLKMNIRTGITEFLCSFEKEKKIESIHVKAFCYESLIWFIPQYGEYIACYNIDGNSIEYFDVPGEIHYCPEMEEYYLSNHGERIVPKYFDAGRIDEENVYLIPAGTETAVVLNMKTKKMICIPVVINSDNEFFGCGTYYEGKIWMAPYNGNQLVSVDIHTCEIQRIDCGLELGKYYGIYGYSGKIWFSFLTEAGVLFWDIQKKRYGQLPCKNMDVTYGKKAYRDIVSYNDALWLLPMNSEKILYLDTEHGCFVEYDCKMKQELGVMIGADAGNDSMYAISYSNNYLIDLYKRSIYIPKINVSQLYDILNCGCSKKSLCMLMERYYGGIPEKNLAFEGYIALLIYDSFSGDGQNATESNYLMAKTGKTIFQLLKRRSNVGKT